MKGSVCYIFSAAPINDYSYIENVRFEGAFIIVCDGGIKHTEILPIKPNVIIGDGDSSNAEYPIDVEYIKYDSEKDKTDTHIAVEYAIGKGFKEIIIYGGLGGRRDHEYANIAMLDRALDFGASVRLLNKQNDICMTDGEITITEADKKYISLLPYSERARVSTEGLKYELDNFTLKRNETTGVSNESMQEKITIKVHEGKLLIIQSSDM